MHRGAHVAIATVLILASNAGDGGCQAANTPGYNCHVTVGDLQVADSGRVTAEVRNWCDTGLGPQSQTFMTWIESRRNGDDKWLVVSPVGIEREPPDAEGFVYHLRDGRCQQDVEYGAAWRAYGADHHGLEFDTDIKRKLFGVTGLC